MYYRNIVTEKLMEVNRYSKTDIKRIESRIKTCDSKANKEIENIKKELLFLTESTNKETILLLFRRLFEKLLRIPVIISVRNIYDGKIHVVREDNMLFCLDKKYYSNIELVSFLDVFEIETNDFSKVFKNWNFNGEPHIGLILSYVQNSYNGSYRFFYNRNREYHCIYSLLYELGKEIKEIIDILNSYHYNEDSEISSLYNMETKDVKEKVSMVVKKSIRILNDF